MAHRIGLESVRIAVGPRLLLDDVTLGIEDGLRVGVLGPNGAGKSTLLAALAGAREVDGGRVTRAGGTRVAMLRQADDLPGATTVRRAVHGGAPEHEWASDPAVRDIHAGLLADIDPGAEVAALSGGQRRRVALAAVLTCPADVLLLDEPTNHLDVEGVDWLARHLNARLAGRRADAGALVVVTHDRWFLDAVCTRVWEVVPAVDPGGGRAQVPGRIETYDGGYAAYVLARAERARQAAVAAAKRENLLRKELAWLRRGAPARTSKPRFRIEAAEALIADVPPPRDAVRLTAMATARLGKKVLDLEGVTVRYPATGGAGEREVLRRVTWRLAPGERVGVVGVNGAGKTTLLRLLMTEPNVLLLDEPTNDLDTDTLAAVEDILDSFPGTLVVVSHDRYLLERVTDHQVALPGDGSLRDLPGGVEQYLAIRREAAAAPAAPDGARSGKGEGDAPAARRRRAAKNLARIERRMDRAAGVVEALHARLEAVSADPSRAGELARLGRDLVAARAEHEELETAWLEAAQALEEA